MDDFKAKMSYLTMAKAPVVVVIRAASQFIHIIFNAIVQPGV